MNFFIFWHNFQDNSSIYHIVLLIFKFHRHKALQEMMKKILKFQLVRLHHLWISPPPCPLSKCFLMRVKEWKSLDARLGVPTNVFLCNPIRWSTTTRLVIRILSAYVEFLLPPPDHMYRQHFTTIHSSEFVVNLYHIHPFCSKNPNYSTNFTITCNTQGSFHVYYYMSVTQVTCTTCKNYKITINSNSFDLYFVF